MRQCHQEAINGIIEKYKKYKNYLALILVGSLASRIIFAHNKILFS